MRSGRYLKNNPQPACHSAADAVAQALAYLRPPDRLGVSAWADANRIMDGSSPYRGPWQTSRTPYLREIMDAAGPDSPCRMVVFLKPAQIGGTESLLNLCGYFMENAPCPVMLIQPTVETAKRFSKQRLDPVIESIAALSGLVKDKRSRDSGDTVLMKSFRGGVLVITGANSAVGLRSMPCKVVLADEVDAYPPSASNEGDPLSLAMKRTVAFGSQARIFVLSTPTLVATSRVAKLYEESDRRKYFVPCPACRAFQTLRWGQLDLER